MAIACFHIPRLGIAVERLRRPESPNAPMALSGDDSRLVVVSGEAEDRGVRVGQTAVSARVFCSDLTVFPYDQPAYDRAARAIWDIFAIESSFVEPIAPETCFVEITGPDIDERTRRLVDEAGTAAGAPAYAGLAQTRFVARMAARKAASGNPSPLVRVRPGEEPKLLAPVRISDLPEFDGKMQDRLERLGMKTLADVSRIPVEELRKHLKGTGLTLRRLARGEDATPIRAIWPPRQTQHSLRFECEVSDEDTLQEALLRCAEHIATKLAVSREFCRSVTLILVTEDERRHHASERLRSPIDDVTGLNQTALRLLKKAAPDCPFIEVRLIVGELGPGSGVQLSLLDDNQSMRGLPHERKIKLEKATDTIRTRYGSRMLRMAVELRIPRAIQLWTYPLGHLANEDVLVETDEAGTPVSYALHGCRWAVQRIQNQWREAEWELGQVRERTVYRVETDPLGLSELYRSGSQWRLAAVAD